MLLQVLQEQCLQCMAAHHIQATLILKGVVQVCCSSSMTLELPLKTLQLGMGLFLACKATPLPGLLPTTWPYTSFLTMAHHSTMAPILAWLHCSQAPRHTKKALYIQAILMVETLAQAPLDSNMAWEVPTSGRLQLLMGTTSS